MSSGVNMPCAIQGGFCVEEEQMGQSSQGDTGFLYRGGQKELSPGIHKYPHATGGRGTVLQFTGKRKNDRWQKNYCHLILGTILNLDRFSKWIFFLKLHIIFI